MASFHADGTPTEKHHAHEKSVHGAKGLSFGAKGIRDAESRAIRHARHESNAQMRAERKQEQHNRTEFRREVRNWKREQAQIRREHSFDYYGVERHK